MKNIFERRKYILKDIIEKVQRGDEEAFRELTQLIGNDLYRVARTRLKDIDDINDAIQNTMIYTYRHIKKIKNIESFKSWMLHILINECNKIYNKNKRNNNLFSKLAVNSEKSLYDNSIQVVQDKMNFEALIEKLNYEEKLVITLHYNSQLSCSQIAKILNMSTNTIKSRLTRGVKKLKKFYEEVNLDETKRI